MRGGNPRPDADADAGKRRPVLVALVARAPAANKCVGVAEIAKREFVAGGEGGAEGGGGGGGGRRPCCQYTGLWTRLEEAGLAGVKAREDDGEDDGEGSDAMSVEAFESPKEIGRKKVRGMPCLVVYLALEPVAMLQKAYG